jgi:hypothetical protein
VIDFKSGTGEENVESHEAQMRKYLKIIAQIYSGIPVSGYLAYVDSGRVRAIA